MTSDLTSDPLLKSESQSVKIRDENTAIYLQDIVDTEMEGNKISYNLKRSTVYP